MPRLAKAHIDRLDELKNYVLQSNQNFKDNNDRFDKFIRFVYKTSLTESSSATLASTGTPDLEFNSLEAQISELMGEFIKQQPAIIIRAADGVPSSEITKEMVERIKVLQSYFRAIFLDSSNDMLRYKFFKDLLSGGFTVANVYTEYPHPYAFHQLLKVGRAFDVTLTGFDPLARESHKGDGRFCFEIYPLTKKEFELKFGEEALEKIQFSRTLGGFSWSFKNEKEEIILVCDLYEKKKKEEIIVKLANQEIMTKKQYRELLKNYAEGNRIEQPPAVLNERKTHTEEIVRYRFCEATVLDYVETNFRYLPFIFGDGNSVDIKDGNCSSQMTRPYPYHAQGIQKLKNYAGQSLARELESIVQHKFMVSVEAIPEDYQDAYRNVQKAQVLAYNAFYNGDTNVRLDPPMPVARVPIPPEITKTFEMADPMMQSILGNANPTRGISAAPLSGIAYARSAMQSNNASRPYNVGMINLLSRVATVMLDLIPKYWKEPMSIPILKPDGKRDYANINEKGGVTMDYDPNLLQVSIEIGVDFDIQREIAMQTIDALCRSNKGFAEFMEDRGLPILLDNIEIRGIEGLKLEAEAWMKERQQMKQMAMQQSQKQMKLEEAKQMMQMALMKKEVDSPSQGQLGAMMLEKEGALEEANLMIKAEGEETKRLGVLNDIQNSNIENELKAAEIEAEQTRTAVDAAVKIGSHINETLERKRSNEKESIKTEQGPNEAS